MLLKLIKILLPFLFILISSYSILGQEPFYWQLTEEDGLPNMTIYQIHQDKKGFMWFGTENGICRYDGREMKTYYHPDLSDNEILTIQEDSWGRVWFRNLAGQLVYIENEKMNLVEYGKEGTLIEIVIIDSILFIYTRTVDSSGELFVHFKSYEILESGSLGKPFRFDVNYRNGSPRLCVLNNKIYASVINHSVPFTLSLLEFDVLNNKFKRFKGRGKLSASVKFPRNFKISDEQEVLIWDFDDFRILSFDDDSLYLKTDKNIDQDDILLLGNENGAFFQKNEPFKNFYKSFNINTYALIKDKEGNIWGGTMGNGIIIFPQTEILHYTGSNSNLSEDIINVFYYDTRNRLLIGHNGGKISLVDNNVFSQKIIDNRINRVRVINEDSNGNFWFGGNSSKTYQTDNNFNPKEVLPRGGIKDMLFTEKDEVWLCSANYVFRSEYPFNNLKKLRFDLLKYSDILLQERAYALFNTPKDTWIGGTKGIFRYEKNKEEITPFLEKGKQINYSITDITQSKDSTLWFSTLSHGILGIQQDSIIYRFNEYTGLATNNCSNLFCDEFNNLWIGSKKGVHQLDLNTFEIDLINKYDGMPTEDISAIFAKDSTLWVGTQKGLLKIPYTAIHKNNITPPIHIMNVALWDQDTIVLPAYDLAYNQNNLNIEFVGLTYRNQGNTTYKYRMLGLDTNWISTTTRFARYPILPPGDYEFQVKAINEDGVNSILPAKIQFFVNKPWWQTWWFYLVTFLGLVGIIGGFFYQRFKQVQKEERQQREFNEKINALRMMALQAQMNPHFVFNALSAIQKFLTTNEQEPAMIYLARFAQLIRMIFEQSKEQFITLDEEFEFLQLYLDLEKLRFKDKVTIDFIIDSSITKDDYDMLIPPLIIQPIIENAFKHGLMHKEKGGQLIVEFSKDINFLICKIEDNGVGRAMAKKMGEGRLRQERSSGLKTALERLEILNKSSKTEKVDSLSIKDLVDENQNPIGTRVEIKIKYEG